MRAQYSLGLVLVSAQSQGFCSTRAHANKVGEASTIFVSFFFFFNLCIPVKMVFIFVNSLRALEIPRSLWTALWRTSDLGGDKGQEKGVCQGWANGQRAVAGEASHEATW